MLVSVIIPVYNAEKYLRRCLNSVLEQTYTNWEAIIVDDGSVDGSGAIADNYLGVDGRFRIIHKKNEGQSLARLDGVECAAGEIVMFLDSDDFWEKHCLEKIVGAFEHHNPDVVMFPAVVIDENGNVIRHIGNGLGNTGFISRKMVCEKLLTSHDLNSLWLKAFKRELVDVDEIKSTTKGHIRIGEDKVMLFPLIDKANRIFYIEEPLYHYVYCSSSISHSVNPAKIRALIAKEMFAETYKYMIRWEMDTEVIREQVDTYYLKNLMSCYFKARKSCKTKDDKKMCGEYPWKDALGRNIYKYLVSRQLQGREKIKLIIMSLLVR